MLLVLPLLEPAMLHLRLPRTRTSYCRSSETSVWEKNCCAYSGGLHQKKRRFIDAHKASAGSATG